MKDKDNFIGKPIGLLKDSSGNDNHMIQNIISQRPKIGNMTIPKLRAYIKETGEITSVQSIDYFIHTICVPLGGTTLRLIKRHHFYDVIIMQYMWEEDTNGIGIYQDDVVLVPEHYSGDITIREYVGRVVVGEGEFYITSKEHEYQSLFDDGLNPSMLKVIGNIHQNPELLKGES